MRLVMPSRRRWAALAATLALGAGTLPGPVIAGGAALPSDCASIMATDDIEEGMTGRGWTVAHGDTPERFKVKVLGTLPDGIAPGKDLIVIKVTDVAGSDIIRHAGGIWAGMSGSPVYVDGLLIGAVAYGFTAAPSRIGGVTPAQEMLEVLEYDGSAPAAAERDASTVRIPADLREKIAAQDPSAGAQDEMSRLRLPLSVSGLSASGRERLQEYMDELGIPVIVTSGSSAPSPTGGSSFGRPVPGGNFVGVLSYGDVTAGGVGTATYVCGDQALAFGHPLTFSGRTTFGANDADAIRIVRDDTFGSFKLATIEELFGTVDQDRLAAIRGALGDAPPLVPISARVRDLDTGNERNGGSQATTDEFVPIVSLLTLASNIDVTIDRLGPGSSKVRWIVNGHRANGDPWTLRRTNRFADEFDIAFGSADELFSQLAAIEANEFEDISFDDVELRATIDATLKQFDIENVKVSVNGGPYREREQLEVQPGDDLSIRAKVRQYRGSLQTETLSLVVPDVDEESDGSLVVAGGGSQFSECDFDPSACESGGGFLGLLETLEDAPKNNHLTAELQFFGPEGPADSASDTERLDREVNGFVEIFVFVPFGGP